MLQLGQILLTVFLALLRKDLSGRRTINVRTTAAARAIIILDNNIQTNDPPIFIIPNPCLRLEVQRIELVAFDFLEHCLLEEIVYWLIVLENLFKVVLLIISYLCEILGERMFEIIRYEGELGSLIEIHVNFVIFKQVLFVGSYVFQQLVLYLLVRTNASQKCFFTVVDQICIQFLKICEP